jgi:hypothetical protein
MAATGKLRQKISETLTSINKDIMGHGYNPSCTEGIGVKSVV